MLVMFFFCFVSDFWFTFLARTWGVGVPGIILKKKLISLEVPDISRPDVGDQLGVFRALLGDAREHFKSRYV